MLNVPLDVVSTGVAPCALVRLQFGRRLLLYLAAAVSDALGSSHVLLYSSCFVSPCLHAFSRNVERPARVRLGRCTGASLLQNFSKRLRGGLSEFGLPAALQSLW